MVVIGNKQTDVSYLHSCILLVNLMMDTESSSGDHALAFVENSSPRRFINHPDVVLELCQLLSHFCWNESLLAFGSTCKALFELAMDVLWRSLDELVDLLRIIPNFVLVDDHFVCYSISGNGFNFKFAHLIVESRQFRACSRRVSCPDSTCMRSESDFYLGIIFSPSSTWTPMRAHTSQVSGVH